MSYQYNDGGRSAAGFKGKAGDCVVRSICIAMNLDYKATYKLLAQANKDYGNEKSARNGLSKKVYIPFLQGRRITWWLSLTVYQTTLVTHHIRWSTDTGQNNK
jgi:hypothetical protein